MTRRGSKKFDPLALQFFIYLFYYYFIDWYVQRDQKIRAIFDFKEKPSENNKTFVFINKELRKVFGIFF